jgi:hypothetical protein
VKILSAPVLFIAFLVLSGCSDDKSAPSPPKPIDYDGTYELTAALVSNSCSIQLPAPPGSLTVSVEGDLATIGGVACTFNTSTGQAVGSWPPDCTDLGHGCACCTIGSYYVSFIDSEHFNGTLRVLYDYQSSCIFRDCEGQWMISGQKIVPFPDNISRGSIYHNRSAQKTSSAG